jgi:hypothetical protein
VSRNFLGIPLFPLNVPIVGKPLLLAKKSSYPPTAIPIVIDWNVPWNLSGNLPNVGLTFNLLTGAVKAQIDIIQSVYIDNTASPIPVYVHFPSTGMTISVAPATADWFPAVTEDLLVQVFAEGLVVGQIPTTQIMFTNVLIAPYSDPELNFSIAQGLASPAITRGNNIFNTNFGIAALGDQTVSYDQVFANSSGAAGHVLVDHLWNTPYASGFLYLTHIDVSSIGVGSQFTWSIDSITAGGTTLYEFSNRNAPNNQIVNARLSSMNVKLDATLNWQMRIVTNLLTGTDICDIFSTFVWTNNPN